MLGVRSLRLCHSHGLIVSHIANKYGNGRHIKNLTSQDLSNFWKVRSISLKLLKQWNPKLKQTYYVSEQFYGVAITAIKVSILFFYKRVFSTSPFRRQIYAVGFLVLGWFVTNNTIFAFQCRPIRKAWDFELSGHCLNPLRVITIVQVFNVVLDGILLALPISAVLRLQMSTTRKLSVLAFFLLGGL